MFEVGRFYMHTDCSDICIQIVQTYGDVYDINWWNLGYTGNPWITFGESKKLKYTDDWVDITDRMNVKRETSGLPKKEKK